MLAKRFNEFYSYAQYSEMENSLTEFKVEFIAGIILINSANGYHQLCQNNIAYFLSTYFLSKKCQVMSEYKVEFIKEDDGIINLIPDIAVYCDYKNILGPKTRDTPSIIVEILSESTRINDFNMKREIYALNGVKEYWLVDYSLKEIYLYDNISNLFIGFKNNDILKSSVYEDLTIPLSDIFKF